MLAKIQSCQDWIFAAQIIIKAIEKATQLLTACPSNGKKTKVPMEQSF